MPSYLLCHRHEPAECDAAYAAWLGFASPLRRSRPVSSCLTGGHAVVWVVEAADAEGALALLPPYVAGRTALAEVRPVDIP
jgi:hypothetical protein